MALYSMDRCSSHDDQNGLCLWQCPSHDHVLQLLPTDKTPTSFNPLKFGDDIQNAGALIAAVTRYVQQHNIKVLDRRTKTKR